MGTPKHREMLAQWPIDIPKYYDAFIHGAVTAKELEEIRYAVRCKNLYGSDSWSSRLQDEHALRERKVRGRPKKGT